MREVSSNSRSKYVIDEAVIIPAVIGDFTFAFGELTYIIMTQIDIP